MRTLDGPVAGDQKKAAPRRRTPNAGFYIHYYTREVTMNQEGSLQKAKADPSLRLPSAGRLGMTPVRSVREWGAAVLRPYTGSAAQVKTCAKIYLDL